MSSRSAAAVWVFALLVAWSAQPAGHDLPADVVVQLFVKPEGERLRVIVRAPMSAMGDVDYPTRGPAGLLDLDRIPPALEDAARLWIVPNLHVFENDRPVGEPRLAQVRISLPSDRSFTSYERALEHAAGPPIPAGEALFVNQGTLDAVLDYPIQSDRSAISIHPELARLGVRVTTVVRFLPPGGAVRAFELTGDPGVVRLDPRWHHAAFGFVHRGFRHILEGFDHLLFLVCLVIPLRRFAALVPVVTAFAVGHSITLVAATFDLAPGGLWFPPLIETLIAVSILYMALENMLAAVFDHRWMMAFGFGLVHGFGFSFALRESLQFAGSHLVASLVAFNVGVELGQLLMLLIVIPPLALLFRVTSSPRATVIVLSALVAHAAWHWMVDRGRTLGQYRFEWPAAGAALAAQAAGWLLLLVIAAGALWLLSLARKKGSGDIFLILRRSRRR
jgi:hypothetical protein